MLRQSHRLRRSADVRRVRQSGRSWRHPLAVLLASPRENGRSVTAPETRFAFVANRHVGTAVVRNRAKRLLREAVRHHLDEIAAGWDCVFIARRQTPQATFAEVEQAVLELLARAQLRPRRRQSGVNGVQGAKT